MIDYSKIKKKLLSDPDGQDVLRLRTAVIAAVASDGKVELTLDGVSVPDVSVLGSAVFVVGSIVQVLSYRGSLLVLGGSNAASSRPVQAEGTTSNGTTTAVAFTNTLTTTGIHGVAFIAPPSGMVYVAGRAVGGNSNAAQFTHLDVEVRQGAVVGSGTVFRAASNNTASVFQSDSAAQQGEHVATSLVTGLTAGSAYNACLTYFVSANTGTYNRRHIAVLPQ